jgi:hypothetical protein
MSSKLVSQGRRKHGAPIRNPSATEPVSVRDVGLLDRIKKRPSHDEEAIREMLEGKGATAEQAQEIVEILGRRLSPDEMHIWLADPDKSHPIPDTDAAKEFEAKGLIAPASLNWTPINAVSAGKTKLVIDEAKRYAPG